jgi:hypothetical protein
MVDAADLDPRHAAHRAAVRASREQLACLLRKIIRSVESR